MSARDRRRAVAASAVLNGIDFVEVVGPAQAALRVHFLNAVPLRDRPPVPTIAGGETVRAVAVDPVDDAAAWSEDDGHLVLALGVPGPGDFSDYTLTIDDPALDRQFRAARFSFKANCPSDLDCRAPAADCPPADAARPPIDYLAKDFSSFRKALSDFSALRYPQWRERGEADFGVMFMEALCAVADDLSYQQDRVAAEAALDTATQRRSVTRLARLVDYEPRPAVAARALLRFVVTGTAVPPGLAVAARLADGSTVDFEAGGPMIDPVSLKPAPRAAAAVDPRWNRLDPWWWDDDGRCLAAGATELWVVGHRLGLRPGQQLLIETRGASTADPPLRHVVTLAEAGEEAVDPIFGDGGGPAVSPPGGTPVTRVQWGRDTAPTKDHDLTRTVVAGNLVLATQARTTAARFCVGDPPVGTPGAAALPRAVYRVGPNGTSQFLVPLPDGPLAWLAEAAGSGRRGTQDPDPVPEIAVARRSDTGAELWRWARQLIDAGEFDPAYTLDAARLRPTARTEPLPPGTPGHLVFDYDGDGGDALRFGDGTFGRVPEDGDVFDVTYRVGGGAAGNVGPDTITQIDPAAAAAAGVTAVSNPFPAEGGDDPEPLDRVRRRAPQQFRNVHLRAVRPEDYEEQAQTLPWVQRAGTAFRWTGSWLTVFTAADPLGSAELPVADRLELIDLLNRRRLAGYESYVPAPRYVSVDLVVEVCAAPQAFRGDVKAGVLAALGTAGAVPPAGRPGFFHPDRFTFGTPLDPGDLQRAVQAVPGVAGVLCVRYRRRGVARGFVELREPAMVGVDQILRVENDPSRPDRGSLKVVVRGGK